MDSIARKISKRNSVDFQESTYRLELYEMIAGIVALKYSVVEITCFPTSPFKLVTYSENKHLVNKNAQNKL